MKIIQIMDNFSTGGGVNSFVYDLCHALRDKGCNIVLIGLLEKGYKNNQEIEMLRKNGVEVLCMGAKSKKDALLTCIPKLRSCIKKLVIEEVAICNLHLKLSVLMGVVATLGLKNVCCVETYHNTYHHYFLQCVLLSPYIQKYICVSQTSRDEMHRRFGTPYKKIVAIPNGVSRQNIRNLAKISEYSFGDYDKLVIVSVGRLSYEKNFAVPIRALLNVCNENISYTIIGGGPQEQELRKLAKENPFIHLLGSQSREKTLEELAKADIVIMSSLWEGRSILQLEAMALDKPMIISDVPGLRETFGERELEKNEIWRRADFGYIVKVDNEAAYRAAILDFNKRRENVTIMSKKISEISKRNDISETAKKYCQVYNDVYV